MILQSVLSGENVIVYDNRLIEEYNAVLHYKKFKFRESDISDVLNVILRDGILVNGIEHSMLQTSNESIHG